MVYINHNNAMKQLQQIVESSLQKNLVHMPRKFEQEQLDALHLLQQRIYLEEVVEESVSFNRTLSYENGWKNTYLVGSVEELMKVFRLRSDIYTEIGYQNEFPDTIEGLNFDVFDTKSAILYYKNGEVMSGTSRLIFDSEHKLPVEEKYSLDTFRANSERMGEFSRLVVRHEEKGLSLEFKHLMGGLYNVVVANGVDLIMSGIKEEHYKLYEKFGAVSKVAQLDGYGELDLSALVISWDPLKISNFFKRAFLR